MGEIIEETGERAAEYGETLGYLHQLANKVGETLAFDRIRSVSAKDDDKQFYSEDRGERHVAIAVDASTNIQRIKRLLSQHSS